MVQEESSKKRFVAASGVGGSGPSHQCVENKEIASRASLRRSEEEVEGEREEKAVKTTICG